AATRIWDMDMTNCPTKGGIQQNLTRLHEVDNNSNVTSNQTLMMKEINKTYNMTSQFVLFYQPNGISWSYLLYQKGTPPSRRRSTSTVIDSKGIIYIFGGRVQVDTGSPIFVSYYDLYTFDTVLLTWNQINATNVPSPRSHAAPVIHPSGKILYIGGVSQAQPGVDVDFVDMNEIPIFETISSKWSYKSIIVQPRIAHTANLMPDNNEIIIIGGSSTKEPYEYSELITSGDNPPPLAVHTANLYQNYLIVAFDIQCKKWVTTFTPGKSICNRRSNIDAGIVCLVLGSIIGILYKRGVITYYINKIGDWLNTLADKNLNIISSESWMEIYNVSKQNVIYEDACSNNFSHFELSNSNIPKSKERHNIVYDDIYNDLSCIELLKPNIAISNNGKSKICDGADCITIFDFMPVHATITQGITPAACDNVEKLLSLLNKQKISIYKVLGSQPVYALGPDFQQGHHIPCIACWSIKPIDISIMKQLSALFDDEFEIVNHINDNDGNQGEMLNEICQLSHGFVGYYLDSIKIRVAPLPCKSNDIFNLFTVNKEY
ncbi:24861_t:CDS:2, partial [Gigaspora rosea]